MGKIDSYLRQEMRREGEGAGLRPFRRAAARQQAVEAETGALESADEDAAAPAPAEEPRFPMLLRVRRPDWSRDVPGLAVHGQVGNVLSCTGTERTLELLAEDDDVLTIEASRPLQQPECAQSIPFVHADRVHAPAAFDERGDRALFAMIDTGIDVLHQAFLDAGGRTRIHALWDQTDPTGPAPAGSGFGSLHTRDDIQGYVDAGVVPPRLGRDVLEHGTHVASIAAGRAAGGFAGGMAPESLLLVVKSGMAVAPGEPQSIGYSHHHVAALAWVLDEAARLGMPVALNVSQGMNAGAHDGTSLLEAAFDEFTGGGRAPGVVAVKSAGNERHLQGHARLSLLSNSVDEVAWLSNARRRQDDVVEVWFRSCDQLAFRLRAPTGETTPSAERATPEVAGHFSTGEAFDLDFDRLHRDNGDSRLVVRVTSGPQGIQSGEWVLEIAAGRVHHGSVHAWIERRQERAIVFSRHLDEEYSLSIPGTARTVIAVGSVGSASPLALAASSSYGPTRDGREKPDLCAPGASILGARAGSSDGVIPMGGTSMAAPHVSGALCLLMSYWEKRADRVADWRRLNAAQMRAALIGTSRSFRGDWNRGMGFGALDAEALLADF